MFKHALGIVGVIYLGVVGYLKGRDYAMNALEEVSKTPEEIDNYNEVRNSYTIKPGNPKGYHNE